LTADEKEILDTVPLLSRKPVIYAANINEDEIADIDDLENKNPYYAAVVAHAREEGSGVIPICAGIEAELAELDDDEKEMFLKSAREKMLKLNYSKWSEVPYYQKKLINKQTCAELGWAYVYNDYVLTLNRSGIKQVTKERLNDEVCKKIYQSRQGNLKEYSRELITDCIDTIIKL
jgi:ribosome-binding ATPase YchF (GTP1/OBG family)